MKLHNDTILYFVNKPQKRTKQESRRQDEGMQIVFSIDTDCGLVIFSVSELSIS
jgi:hypothetical protein